MKVEDLLHSYILELLRRGFTIAHVAEALASQKVKLMQSDEYIQACNQAATKDQK